MILLDPQNLGYLIGQDHGFDISSLPLEVRGAIYLTRVFGREIDAAHLGSYFSDSADGKQTPQMVTGDWLGLTLWEEKDRGMPGWMDAWPAISFSETTFTGGGSAKLGPTAVLPIRAPDYSPDIPLMTEIQSFIPP